jgi:CheY-like chemotaxis protein
MTQASWKDQAQARGVHYEAVSELGPVPLVIGDASDLREALTNLIFNALDAMPQGGRLTIRLTADRGRVRCDVVDTGVGMAREVRERVFEPFFTTKKSEGSGLGLSVVYGIVTRSGGEVSVESTPGLGSTFTFWLPAVVAPSVPRSTEPAAAAPARPARILVVDDEPHILEAVAEVLTLDGHAVVACPNGNAALESLQNESFDLVLTDLGMPGIGGWDVVRAVKERRPGTPVGLITGWSDSLDAAEVKRRGVDFVVAKPFRMRDIRDAIARWVA